MYSYETKKNYVDVDSHIAYTNNNKQQARIWLNTLKLGQRYLMVCFGLRVILFRKKKAAAHESNTDCLKINGPQSSPPIIYEYFVSTLCMHYICVLENIIKDPLDLYVAICVAYIYIHTYIFKPLEKGLSSNVIDTNLSTHTHTRAPFQSNPLDLMLTQNNSTRASRIIYLKPYRLFCRRRPKRISYSTIFTAKPQQKKYAETTFGEL